MSQLHPSQRRQAIHQQSQSGPFPNRLQ